MKHFARDDLYRNVLPLPYRVQIHMNLLDHRRPFVSQVCKVTISLCIITEKKYLHN